MVPSGAGQGHPAPWLSRQGARRAVALAAELRRLGVSAQAIVVEAKSNSEPKFHEWMPSGEAGNRRADVFIDY